MSLYVRVLNNFYTHRKTLRLKAAIGEAAFWIPPRLWAYAAENQPDGCLKDYTEQEIATLIGYQGDAEVMLQALLQTGFLDSNPIRIHDWNEHNSYHSAFATRAKKAATARWKGKERKVPERTGQEASIAASSASSISGPDLASAMKWLEDWKRNGADYTESETKSAFLAMQAGGWRWGRNPVADYRAALERQIQTDRERNLGRSSNGGVKRKQHPITGAYLD